MYINFDKDLGEGTHSFNSDTFALYVLESGASFDSRNSGGSGTTTITEKTDTTIKGTFSYTAPGDAGGTVTVTDGSFNVVFR